MRWRIYYHDGSTYSWRDGSPETAPGRGVIVIVTEQHDGRIVRPHTVDYYCWHGRDGWYGHDSWGLADCLGETGWRTVKQGRNIRDDLFARIVGLAADDNLEE